MKLLKLLGIILLIISINGCKQTTVVIPKEETPTSKINQTLDDTIISIANQLAQYNKIKSNDTGTITVTSFVDLDNLNKTSQFGRVIAESLFTELFIRGFNVTEFRGKNAISINGEGEFYITRDIEKLQSEVPNTYVVVGTYSKIDDYVVINVRMIDNKTGKIVSSARTLYANDNCAIFGICNNAYRKIRLVKDDCPPYQECSTNNKPIIKEDCKNNNCSSSVKKLIY